MGPYVVRTRLIGQVDEQRNPRTRATVERLMDRYLDVEQTCGCPELGPCR
jgi:hypothetical protein